jgi:hypothetical protein
MVYDNNDGPIYSSYNNENGKTYNNDDEPIYSSLNKFAYCCNTGCNYTSDPCSLSFATQAECLAANDNGC